MIRVGLVEEEAAARRHPANTSIEVLRVITRLNIAGPAVHAILLTRSLTLGPETMA